MATADQVEEALQIIYQYGGIDGAHHKTWVIDQILRKLTGPDYEAWVKVAEGDPEDEDNYYGEWDVGIAP